MKSTRPNMNMVNGDEAKNLKLGIKDLITPVSHQHYIKRQLMEDDRLVFYHQEHY
jgi:hypothetical protein